MQDVSKAKAGGVQLDDKVELVEADVTQGAECVGPPFAPLACCCAGLRQYTLQERADDTLLFLRLADSSHEYAVLVFSASCML